MAINAKISAAKSMGDYTRLLRRRWRYPALILPSALLLAVLVAFLLPVTYRGAATIMLEPATLPSKLVQTTVVQQDDFREHASIELELVRRKVMTPEVLEALVKEVDPYPNVQASVAEKASMITIDTSVEVVDPITYQVSDKSSAFSIYYLNENPKRAQVVTKKLLDLFLSYNQQTRVEAAKQALGFLQQQARELEGSMQDMEKKLAVFKAKYGEALPTAEGRNLSGLDRSQREVEQLNQQIVQAEQQQAMLQLQLNDTPPSLVAAIGDWRTDLAKARADLTEAEQKYTPEHPDVRRLKRVIADLLAQGAAQSKAAAANPDNPDYLRIKSQLNGVERQLAGLRASAARARTDLNTYDSNLKTAPNVEREYTQSQRDYDNAQNQYRDLQNKIKEAALAQSLEAEARGERFSLMKAPVVPSKPYAPNRIAIILLGLMMGVIIAVAAVIISDSADPTVRGMDDLEDILNTTPIGTVPKIFNRTDTRHRRFVFGTVSAGFAVAAALVAVTILIHR
jgi:polysaccharide chain length determinant protein (PEP-CTERM system associated)